MLLCCSAVGFECYRFSGTPFSLSPLLSQRIAHSPLFVQQVKLSVIFDAVVTLLAIHSQLKETLGTSAVTYRFSEWIMERRFCVIETNFFYPKLCMPRQPVWTPWADCLSVCWTFMYMQHRLLPTDLSLVLIGIELFKSCKRVSVFRKQAY